jgi:hypothetical protein
MSAAERAYRLLMRAYPADFRETYGREMLLVFRDQRREVGASGVRFWAELLWDVARSAPAQRLDAFRNRWSGDIQTQGEKMRTMAILAVLIGAAEAATALAEGWAGIANGGGLWLAEVIVLMIAGALLLAAGVAMLRRSPSAVPWARMAAIACLVVVVLIRLVQGWMSIFSQLVGIVFPIALLLFLWWKGGRSGRSARTMACVPLLILGLPIRSSAQGRGQDSARVSLAVKDLPLTAAQRQSYVGNYVVDLPQGGSGSVRVLEENGALKLWASDRGDEKPRRLLSQGDHVFLAENTPDFVLTFVMDGGRATGFNVRKADPGLIVGVRIR